MAKINLRRAASTSLLASITLASMATIDGIPKASADVSQQDIQSLNPRRQKYSTCPNDANCYKLTTRVISGSVRNPSEISGDENYILPIWSIIDGMGIDVHPLATDSDDFFRVNISKQTIGNMGSIFSQRRTRRWVDLQQKRPSAYKLHVNKDYVVPLSRDRWTTEGIIFSVNMMEHDNSRRTDIDRVYLSTARNVQAGLLRNAQNVRVSMRSPTYYGDAGKAAVKFTKEAIPMAAKGYAAYQTGGGAAAAGSVDISSVATLFKNLWNGIKRLDKDDVGQQKTIYIPFKSLTPGVEKVKEVCGTTDPTAFDTGRFCIKIGVKLDLHSSKRAASAFERNSNEVPQRSREGNSSNSGNRREDCLPFNNRNLRLQNRGGRGGWTISDGRQLLFAFGEKKTEAQETLNLIRRYRFNQSCYVGRPGPSMTYLKVNNKVPRFASIPSSKRPNDCISYSTRNLRVQKIGPRWVLTDGRATPLSSPSKAEMVQAKAIIQSHGMTKQCFVGRPNASLKFWLK